MREDIYLYKIFLENIVLDYRLLLLITKWSTQGIIKYSYISTLQNILKQRVITT